MNKLELRGGPRFNTANLKSGDYTRSLLDEGLRIDALDEERAAEIQGGFLDELAGLIELYTEGQSSSVSKEIAEELLQSLLYACDACLLSFKSPGEAFNVLSSKPADELYFAGLRRLKLLIFESTGLLVKARRTRLNLPCSLYNTALDRDIRSALKAYDYRLAAHRLKNAPDYPIAVNGGRMRGIYYIKYYLTCLITENRFCREYDPVEVAGLYTRFCDVQGVGYADSDENIYSLVFFNALFADYLKKEHGTLVITNSDCKTAEKLLGSLSDSEISSILRATALKVSYEHAAYNDKTLSANLPTILKALRRNSLNRYLVVAG